MHRTAPHCNATHAPSSSLSSPAPPRPDQHPTDFANSGLTNDKINTKLSSPADYTASGGDLILTSDLFVDDSLVYDTAVAIAFDPAAVDNMLFKVLMSATTDPNDSAWTLSFHNKFSGELRNVNTHCTAPHRDAPRRTAPTLTTRTIRTNPPFNSQQTSPPAV